MEQIETKNTSNRTPYLFKCFFSKISSYLFTTNCFSIFQCSKLAHEKLCLLKRIYNLQGKKQTSFEINPCTFWFWMIFVVVAYSMFFLVGNHKTPCFLTSIFLNSWKLHFAIYRTQSQIYSFSEKVYIQIRTKKQILVKKLPYLLFFSTFLLPTELWWRYIPLTHIKTLLIFWRSGHKYNGKRNISRLHLFWMFSSLRLYQNISSKSASAPFLMNRTALLCH
jgi:hypothetical protein